MAAWESGRNRSCQRNFSRSIQRSILSLLGCPFVSLELVPLCDDTINNNMVFDPTVALVKRRSTHNQDRSVTAAALNDPTTMYFPRIGGKPLICGVGLIWYSVGFD